MIAPYVEAASNALGGVLDLFVRLALPLALGLAVLASALLFVSGRGGGAALLPGRDWRRDVI
jgi:hypothetical protein